MAVGIVASSLGVDFKETSSSTACSSFAGGDGGDGGEGPDWTNRAGWERPGLGVWPDAIGIDRSDRLTLWRSESGEVLESRLTASSVAASRWTSWG